MQRLQFHSQCCWSRTSLLACCCCFAELTPSRHFVWDKLVFATLGISNFWFFRLSALSSTLWFSMSNLFALTLPTVSTTRRGPISQWVTTRLIWSLSVPFFSTLFRSSWLRTGPLTLWLLPSSCPSRSKVSLCVSCQPTFSILAVYDAIDRLGSLVVRIILRPLEESCAVYFSSHFKRNQTSILPAKLVDLLMALIRLLLTLGLVIWVFSIPYSKLAVAIYGGRWLWGFLKVLADLHIFNFQVNF